MISRFAYRRITWIDVENPTTEELALLSEQYNLPIPVTEELHTHTVRSKVDVHDDIIYLVLHFPRIGGYIPQTEDIEIDFILGKDFVITVRYEHNQSLHRFAKSFEVKALLDRGIRDEHAGFLFFTMMRQLYQDALVELDDIHLALKEVEHTIFEDTKEDTVYTVSKLNRRLVDFRQAIRFHREALASFEMAAKDFYGNDFSYYLTALTGEYQRVQSMLNGHKEILSDLRDTHNTLLSTKTSETVKTLTIISFIMLPLTLITGVFGMNMEFPLIENLNEFFIVLLAMMATGITMFIFFKLRRWL